MGIGVKREGKEVDSRQLKVEREEEKDKRRDFTQRGTEAQRAQRKRGEKKETEKDNAPTGSG